MAEMNSYMLPSGQRCAAMPRKSDRRRTAAPRRGRRARRPSGPCAQRATAPRPRAAADPHDPVPRRATPPASRRHQRGGGRALPGELPAVEHHREDVDADRGHEEAVAVEGELHEHQASFSGPGHVAGSVENGRSVGSPLAFSGPGHVAGSVDDGRSVRPPPSDCLEQVRPEAVELLAVPRPIGAGEPADLQDRTASPGRGDLRPEPPPPHGERAQQAAEQRDREHQRDQLGGVVADLQVDPLADAVEAYDGAVVEAEALAGQQVGPRHLHQRAGVHLGLVDGEDGLAAPVVEAEVAAQHVDGDLRVVGRREHRGDDVAAGRWWAPAAR